MGEWQDIASAPSDGTEFLAAVQVRDLSGNEWWERHVVAVDDETGLILDYYYAGWDIADYSHWQPLPEPPK